MAKIDRWYATAYKLQAAGDWAAAEPLYCRILAQQPRHVEALYLLGSLLAQQGRYAEALPPLERALAVRPQFSEAHNNRGVALKEVGRLDEALASYDAALARRPDYAEALNNRGIALQAAGRLDDAIESFQQATRHKPLFSEALNNLGLALKAKNLLGEAQAAFEGALKGRPDYPEALNNLGMVRLAQGHFEDAITLFDQALALQPHFPQPLNNRGAALKELGRLDEAQASYRHALEVRPDYVEAYYNLGTCLVSTGHLDEARACYDRALALRPDDGNAHWNRALGLLVGGDFAHGWREYEWRFQSKVVEDRGGGRPRWDGTPLGGRTILIYAEQGFGDALNFLRYLPLVKARGGRVLFACQPALRTLLADCAGVDEIFDLPPQGVDIRAACDVQAPLLSLPGIFGTALDSIPANTPRPLVPTDTAEAWRGRLAEIARSVPGRLKVGLVWAGNPTHKNDHNRSCALADFAPLARVPGVVFYGLQKGPAGGQALDAPAGMTIVNVGPALADFADTAAVIEQLDLVIAVDTSVVHLAGALGKPTWALIPFTPDWRWLLGREDSPWYPSLRLFRQPAPRNWAPVIERIAAELARLAGQEAIPTADALAQQGEQAWAARDMDEARRCFRAALAACPTHGRSWNNLAVLAFAHRDFTEALRCLSQTLATDPNHAGALENTARCWEAQGDDAQALHWWQRALQAAPDKVGYWNALGQCCIRQQAWDAARESLAQSLRLDAGQESVASVLRELDAMAPAPLSLRFGT